MIFDNIELHNVEELQACDEGYRMWRLPRWVRENINEKAGNISSGFATGVELRFKMKSDKVTLTFPLVRATGKISAGVASDDDAWKVPENQCLREIECELTVMPQLGDNLAEQAMFEAKAFQNPLMAQCEPVDTRKFMGGRPAVQDTAIAEFFYQDLEYADVKL